VIGKLRNMRTILMRYQRQHTDSLFETQIESLKRSITAAEKTTLHSSVGASDELDQQSDMEPDEIATGRMNGLGPLLGCEGAGSAAYFGVFAHLIKCSWAHGFTKRVRRPPTDPVNAMLSYGYVILTSQVASALAAVGFDPYVGYLHASRYGKAALALDLVEEFRPLIVDSVVLNLLNNQQLEAKNFVTELNACRMSDTTKRLFLEKFEERMQETILHPIFEYKVSYRRCIELQARLLGKYLIGEIDTYTPFAVR
jgi:CRISPR-associated protein Cas1